MSSIAQSLPVERGSCNTPSLEGIPTGAGEYLRHGFDDVTLVWDISTPSLDGVVGRLHALPGTGDVLRSGKKTLGERTRFGRWEHPLGRSAVVVYTTDSPTHGVIRRLHIQYKPAEEGELCAPEALGSRVQALEFKLAQLSLLPASEPWVGRTDVAVDVRFENALDGKAVLDGLRAVRLKSGMYVQTYGNPVTTVAFKAKTRTKARAYCRNTSPYAKTEQGPTYGLLRLEVQDLWPSYPADRRIAVEQVANVEFARAIWERRFGSLGPTVGVKLRGLGRERQTLNLVDRVRVGEMTPAALERMAAFLDLERLGLAAEVYKPHLLRERRREARELGLAANDAQLEPAEVDVSELLAPFGAAWAA